MLVFKFLCGDPAILYKCSGRLWLVLGAEDLEVLTFNLFLLKSTTISCTFTCHSELYSHYLLAYQKLYFCDTHLFFHLWSRTARISCGNFTCNEPSDHYAYQTKRHSSNNWSRNRREREQKTKRTIGKTTTAVACFALINTEAQLLQRQQQQRQQQKRLQWH